MTMGARALNNLQAAWVATFQASFVILFGLPGRVNENACETHQRVKN